MLKILRIITLRLDDRQFTLITLTVNLHYTGCNGSWMKESISFCRKVFLNNFSFPIYIKDESPVVSSSDFLWQWFLRQDVSRLRITALKLIKLNVEIVNSLKLIQSITEGILNSFYIEFNIWRDVHYLSHVVKWDNIRNSKF